MLTNRLTKKQGRTYIKYGCFSANYVVLKQQRDRADIRRSHTTERWITTTSEYYRNRLKVNSQQSQRIWWQINWLNIAHNNTPKLTDTHTDTHLWHGIVHHIDGSRRSSTVDELDECTSFGLSVCPFDHVYLCDLSKGTKHHHHCGLGCGLGEHAYKHLVFFVGTVFCSTNLQYVSSLYIYQYIYIYIWNSYILHTTHTHTQRSNMTVMSLYTFTCQRTLGNLTFSWRETTALLADALDA